MAVQIPTSVETRSSAALDRAPVQAGWKTRLRRWLMRPAIPPRLGAGFRRPEGAERIVTASLMRNYFSLPENNFGLGADSYVATPAGGADLFHHVRDRLKATRERVVPWLDAARPLKGARILEIGSGSGCSSLALGEQGAAVTGLDLSEGALTVARDRCAAYGVDAEFHCANALDAARLFQGEKFDFIIFFASLEHMTHEERLEAMSSTWEMLPRGGLWCVVEAPNRLAMFDYHTSQLPFFHWLPDDLAYKYLAKSDRPEFRGQYDQWNAERHLDFLRRGRGVSYHEFDLAMRPAGQLDVVSALEIFHNESRLAGRLASRFTLQYETEQLLRRYGPKIHRGFYQSYLDLIIRKN
ncbi:MAG: class I SAM-dependent methyltransferase [Bryobacteraceae bacterium]